MNDSNTISKITMRRDPGAAVSFYLALFIMVLPTEADLLVAALAQHKIGMAIAIAALCFSVVFTPFFFAWRRWRREPKKWKSRGYLIATGIMLLLNVLGVSLAFIGQFKLHR